jgi:hypothetical protein
MTEFTKMDEHYSSVKMIEHYSNEEWLSSLEWLSNVAQWKMVEHYSSVEMVEHCSSEEWLGSLKWLSTVARMIKHCSNDVAKLMAETRK